MFAIAAFASQVGAQNIPIGNPGFEANVITPGAFVALQPAGWITYDPSGIIDQSANAVGVIAPAGSTYFPGGAPEGTNAALVYLAGGQTAVAGLQQTLFASLLPNTRYRLSAQIGNIASGTSLPGSSGGAGVFYDLDGFPGYRLDLVAGGIVVASDNNSIGATIPEGQFRRAVVIFDTGTTNAQLGQTLSIRLVNLKMPGTPDVPNIEVDFDDVRLLAGPIPAVATLAIQSVTQHVNIVLTGTLGATYQVQYAGNLSTSNWVALTNVTMFASTTVVPDNQFSLGSSNRFYRALLLE